MGAIDQILFARQPARFREIENLARRFLAGYGGSMIVRDGVFSVTQNYAKRNDIPLEIMRYPFHDDELWAFTFLKKGTIFICVNSGLSLCKQFFATAHELYHIYCFGEDTDQNTIRNGSLLKAENADGISEDQEELEANAFAGVLLMPATAVQEQIEVLQIDERHVEMDDILTMMDVFAIPYKACVLRLYECGVISQIRAIELYESDWKSVLSRINLTGKAKRWQLDGAGTEIFGTLLEDFAFNVRHAFLTASREKSDRKYISSLKRRYGLDVEDV